MPNEMPEHAPGLFDVHLYINPKTLAIEGMFAFTFMGIAERVDRDWLPVTRSETRLDEFTRFIDYEIDWDIGSVPISDVPDGEFPEEHPIVLAFDDNKLTWELIKKFCFLVSDENGQKPKQGE